MLKWILLILLIVFLFGCKEEQAQGPLDFDVELCELGPPNQCDIEKETKDYDPNRIVTKPGSCPVYYADGRRDDTCLGENNDP